MPKVVQTDQVDADGTTKTRADQVDLPKEVARQRVGQRRENLQVFFFLLQGY